MQTPCSAFPDKIQHHTREAALEHLKDVVFRNASTDRSSESRGLHVYQCDACGSWHVGHAPPSGLVWHYAAAPLLDTVLGAGAIPVPEPRAFLPIELEIRQYGADTRHLSVPLSKTFLKRYESRTPYRFLVYVPGQGQRQWLSKDLVVRRPVIWFSRNQRWDYVMSATPAMQIGRASFEVAGQGLVRFGVSPSVAPLRWDDYMTMNHVSGEARIRWEFASEIGDCLASETPIPLEQIQRIEVYFHGAWTPATDVEPEAFDAYVASRQAVYEAAYETLAQKRVELDEGVPAELMRHLTLRPQMTIRKMIEWKAERLHLTEPERIVYEDRAILEILEGRPGAATSPDQQA